jgi:hypothetical protein
LAIVAGATIALWGAAPIGLTCKILVSADHANTIIQIKTIIYDKLQFTTTA